MGWIDRVFGHKHPPTPPPAGKPPAPQQPPAGAPPANPSDTVSIGQGSAPAAQPPAAAGASAPAGSSNANPNGSTPAGLPGSPANSAPTNITIDPVTGKPMTMEEQEARLRERLHVIESVGRGLSGDYKMDLEAGDAWAYDFGSNTIIYKKDDLKGKSEDYAIGVILQETGRRVYSRTPQDPAFKDNPALNFLDNAVEGPRVCNLQTSKYAGAKDFFKTVYDQDILNKSEDDIRADLEASLVKNAGLTPEDARKAVMKMKSPVPRHMQYALGLIYDWYTDGKGKAPDWLRDKNAIRALEATKNDYHEAYRLPREIFDKDLTPKEIIDNAKKSEDIVVNKLWPVYKKLLEMDQKDLGMSMFGNQGGQQGKQGNKSGKNGKPSQNGQGGSSNQSGKPQQGKPGQQGSQSGSGGQASGKPQQGQQQPQQGGSGSSGSQQPQNGQQQPQQGQGGGKADPSQKQPGQGGGQAGDKSDDKQAKQDPSQSDPSQAQKQDNKQDDKQQQGAGKGDKAQGQGQGADNGKESGDAGVPDPKNMDTSDGGQLDDSNLTDEQKEKARKAMEDLDKQYDRQVKSREQRDREEGKGNSSRQSNGSSGSQGGGNGRQTSQIDLPTLQELLKQKAETEQKVENLKTPYEKYYSMLAPLTDEMAGELKNILEENDEMKYIGDFNSGNKLNLRRAMQAAAKYERTGEYDEDIWLRRTDPSKRDYDFVFILDESGSMMDDQKWDNALKGLIMSAEALEELKVHFSVIGFSDQPAIHKSFDDKYDEPFREQMLAQIQRANHGGTNDSDALDTALDMLRQQSSDHQKVVVLITDGQGKEAELRQAIAEADRMGVKVIGVGIGDGMSYVKQVYPEHVVVDQIKDLPYELSDLIRDQILNGVNQ